MMHHAHGLPLHSRPRTLVHKGFTLVEMLIVVAVIIILLGILIVGLNRATHAAQSSHTQALMIEINKGLTRFKEDIGYYPPIIRHADPNKRALVEGPVLGSGTYEEDIQQWYSRTSLAEYLLGYGDHTADGYGYVNGAPPIMDWEKEIPILGFRHPGRDGVWGASRYTGAVADRMKDARGNHRADDDGASIDQGKVYGPYLELSDERLLASLDADGEPIYPGDPGFENCVCRTIVDYWGNPIQYYRRNYPHGSITQSYRPGIDNDLSGTVETRDVPTLSEVICLRPFAVDPGAAADSWLKDEAGDPTTSFALQSAEFALFSPGADKAWDDPQPETRLPYRVDPDELNRDNIVETGK